MVATYLVERFGDPALPAGLAQVLHQRTNGNPLFLSNVVDTLVRQKTWPTDGTGEPLVGGLEAVAQILPESLRQLIEQQLGQLDRPTQAVLEAASVAGAEFAAEAVAAAGGGADVEAVERFWRQSRRTVPSRCARAGK